MNNVLTCTLVTFAVFASSHGYTVVLGQTGSCDNRQAVTATGFYKSKSSDVQSGRIDTTVACSMDMCRIPSSGGVGSGRVWGIDADQTGSTSLARSFNYNSMTRLECDALRGYYTGNPTSTTTVSCGLFWLEMDGADRNNLLSLILGSPGSCNRISSMKIRMTQQNCVYASGTWTGNPGANDVIECQFDVCMSPVLECEPSDSWSTIQTCENPSSASAYCSFQMTTGIEAGESWESTYGVDISITRTTEISAQLGDIFSASASLSLTTGFNWSTSTSNYEMWQESTTNTYQVFLAPGQAVYIKQVVGECGDFTVRTPHYISDDV